MPPLTLFVGLGNPGKRYAKQRHNVGFMVLDAIADWHRFEPPRRKFDGLFREGRFEGRAAQGKVLLLKPQTYMNLSGRSVAQAVRFYKLALGDVVVFHDELDLAAGKVRVKLGGGVAGHNGLKSIGQHLGPGFKRVRIGIGHPGHKALVDRHVLGDFAKADQDWLAPMIDAMAAWAGLLAEGDDASYMNKIALAVQGVTDKPSD